MTMRQLARSVISSLDYMLSNTDMAYEERDMLEDAKASATRILGFIETIDSGAEDRDRIESMGLERFQGTWVLANTEAVNAIRSTAYAESDVETLVRRVVLRLLFRLKEWNKEVSDGR